MAKANRGNYGLPYYVGVTVCEPREEPSSVVLAFNQLGGKVGVDGFPIYLTLSRDESLKLMAELATGLRKKEPAKIERIEGHDMLDEKEPQEDSCCQTDADT